MAQVRESSLVIDWRSNHCATLPTCQLGTRFMIRGTQVSLNSLSGEPDIYQHYHHSYQITCKAHIFRPSIPEELSWTVSAPNHHHIRQNHPSLTYIVHLMEITTYNATVRITNHNRILVWTQIHRQHCSRAIAKIPKMRRRWRIEILLTLDSFIDCCRAITLTRTIACNLSL